MKIAVAGTGYVGLSIATLLSQHNEVMAVDIIPEKVNLINQKKSPIQDEYIEKYLAENAGVWAGNLLNLILYVPFGWTGQRWKMNRKRIIAAAFLLSVCCEELQYFTGRGMADVNDVLFNTLGAVVGAWIASKNLF
jgi:glycopeptide antibiotics resistance protein